ncbi:MULTISPECIES: rhodanese-related sulfurtransferase [unclassified Lactococcus]|uniref:oxygen-dependent tRNA uridine(34) hydroxylase TrhO n=1 Tax=unclassified Lactococcus TaxID=2643510 RepID=UPI00142F738E|nr:MULTISPECIES: rhodanese-related sulfurtransferase [unclassified Lactococcus]KAF6606918.1 rhodanese-related sulfurtransferase [Lactococcus sp. EKM201L]KAF6611667.1 rhodanese-related sulfurtransferase [Lactococcus sp. EKM203L]KAF6640179.1 rhodanese-related sulfurtransferase [Lactococcus sp. EKM501L]KAF6642813.1 rhodanese-related sulfurtransferase [Lactococcus sp. EKM502L]KAF6650958.1 rhodanese-related sulfurtransferase [Lactococcus sp. EKM101L]
MTQDYRVLLYYQYVPIEDGETFAQKHLANCKELGLKGRILVADEGINGTVSGTIEQTNAYMELMKNDPRFSSTIFKIDEAEQNAFKKMHVRYRPKLVNLSLEDDVNPLELTGAYLDPKEFREAMLDENTVVIDARNDYEFDLGHFRGAIRPEIRSFRELPQWIRDNKEQFMEKRVLTYCTGGIRCEKFSGWLVREGFKDVGQLHGGIATYGKDPEVQGDLWDGQMYVFDSRIAVPINQKEHVIVGRDWFDGSPCERYINCGNPECNRQMLASEENEAKYLGACSHECRVHPNNRYIKAHQLSNQEVQERLALLEKDLAS